MQEDHPTSAKIHRRCRVVFLRSFISALMFLCFSSPSLPEIKFYRNVSLVSALFSEEGLLNQLVVRGRTCYCAEMNAFRAGDEHFSARDERVENALSNFSHKHTASYQRLPSRPWVEMIATHKYSPPKTGGITLLYTHLRV